MAIKSANTNARAKWSLIERGQVLGPERKMTSTAVTPGVLVNGGAHPPGYVPNGRPGGVSCQIGGGLAVFGRALRQRFDRQSIPARRSLINGLWHEGASAIIVRIIPHKLP